MKCEIKLPMDSEGYTELQCPYCCENFKVKNDEFTEIDHSNLYCPICGLTKPLNEFFMPNVYDKAIEMAKKEMYDIINKTLFKGIKSTKNFNITTNKLELNENKILRDTNYSMIISKLECCNVNVKVKEIDQFIGVYCPYCGRSY